MPKKDDHDAKALSAIKSVIESLSHPNVTVHTKYEQGLNILKNAGKEGVPWTDLQHLYTNNVDSRKAVNMLILRLNEKLEEHGHKIERISYYRIKPIDE